MFGYITPCIPELKVRDRELYNAYYCGVCRALGKYGMGSKMTLTYDATFAAVLLSAVTGTEPSFRLRGCPVHPVRGKTPMVDPDKITDYCAAVCVLLAKYKLLDDARDGRPLRKAALPVISRGVRSAERKYPEAAEALSSGLAVLGELENEKECDPDAAPLLFGDVLGRLLAACPELDGDSRPVIRELGRKLGGFVYVIDAWDDRAEDEKRGSYNIFLRSKLDSPEEVCAATVDMYVNSAVLAYDLLDIKLHKSLLDNIMYMGLAVRAAEVLRGDKKDDEACPAENAKEEKADGSL
jgi:hypothetical protein